MGTCKRHQLESRTNQRQRASPKCAAMSSKRNYGHNATATKAQRTKGYAYKHKHKRTLTHEKHAPEVGHGLVELVGVRAAAVQYVVFDAVEDELHAFAPTYTQKKKEKRVATATQPQSVMRETTKPKPLWPLVFNTKEISTRSRQKRKHQNCHAGNSDTDCIMGGETAKAKNQHDERAAKQRTFSCEVQPRDAKVCAVIPFLKLATAIQHSKYQATKRDNGGTERRNLVEVSQNQTQRKKIRLRSNTIILTARNKPIEREVLKQSTAARDATRTGKFQRPNRPPLIQFGIATTTTTQNKLCSNFGKHKQQHKQTQQLRTWSAFPETPHPVHPLRKKSKHG